MGLFEGKTPTERNKLIAAGVLGVVALVALYLAFGRSFFGGSTTAAPKNSPTPRTTTSTNNTGDRAVPSLSEQEFVYQTTPVDYAPGYASAPDPGRNIFAFYEPPKPCDPRKPGDCPPSPIPSPTPTIPPSPVPTPPIALRVPIPMNVYAGSPGFRLQVDGTPFTPTMKIYFDGVEMATSYVNQNKLSTEVSANLIAQPGQRVIAVRTPDGMLYSNTVLLMVNPPPKPTVQYIGMIGRSRYNNDTAYFIGAGAGTTPFGARLNDVVSGQFRLINITPAEVVFEDINLGFKHRVAITKTQTGTGPGGTTGFPFSGSIPGIPDNIPRMPSGQQGRPTPRPGEKKDDVDDKDDPPS